MPPPPTPPRREAVPATGPASSTLKGIGLSAAGYGLFSVQDATVKWLVGTYAVPEILLLRSLVIIAIAAVIGGRPALRAVGASRNKTALMGRAALILVAWLSYYTAAGRLALAELTTLYFAAPVIAVVLSRFVLHEPVDVARWGAVAVGFVGVVIAADPHGGAALGPVVLALFAACCWGLSVVLVRLINRSETTATQMLASNGLFALACAGLVVPFWRTPDAAGLALMLGLGIAGGLGQFLLYEGFRYAPASAVAPVEYTGLVWAFLYGFAIWREVPGWRVVAGAGLIVVASLVLILVERWRSRAAVPAKMPLTG